jgi:hypothetical protein
MLKSKFFLILAGAVALGALALTITAARADIFPITSDHCSPVPPGVGCLNGGSGGNITVTQEATNTVDVTVALASPLTSFARSSGQGAEVLFNLPFASVILEGDTPPFLGPTPPNATTVNTGNLSPDGAGTFTYSLQCTLISTTCNGGDIGVGTTITFDVTATGITPASYTANTDGNFFAVDVRGFNQNTGLVDSHTRIVPAPVIGHGLFVLLAVGGVLFGGRFLEGLKKRHLHAA